MNQKPFRRRTIQLNIRITEQEKKRIDANAAVNGMSISEYLRHLLILDGEKKTWQAYSHLIYFMSKRIEMKGA